MNVKKLITDDSAVSPVVGVILMVAITVLLAATAASFFLGMTGQTTETPQTAVQFDYTASSDHKDDKLTIKHSGGDTLRADNVAISLTDATSTNPGVISQRFDWNDIDDGSPTDISAGMDATISEQSLDNSPQYSSITVQNLNLKKASVSVVWDNPENDQTFTLAEWTAPTAE